MSNINFQSFSLFIGLVLIICPNLKGQNIDIACNSSTEFSDTLRHAFEVQMKQVYNASTDEEIYLGFLKFISFDPLANSWIINISRSDVPDSLKRHRNFQKFWTKDQKESDIILEEVISNDRNDEEREKFEIWDVDTESYYFNCLKESDSKKLQTILYDIEAIGGFLSPRLLANVLIKTLIEEDYSQIEVQNFIAINLYFTTLINLNQD